MTLKEFKEKLADEFKDPDYVRDCKYEITNEHPDDLQAAVTIEDWSGHEYNLDVVESLYTEGAIAFSVADGDSTIDCDTESLYVSLWYQAVTNWVKVKEDNQRAESAVRAMASKVQELENEIEVLRRHGNKDCTSQADEELERQRKQQTPDKEKGEVKGDC